MKEATIGSSIDCDINIASEYISRTHCKIVYRGEEVWVEDLDSSNGTFVDGRRLSQGERVKIDPTSTVSLAKEVEIEWNMVRKNKPKKGREKNKKERRDDNNIKEDRGDTQKRNNKENRRKKSRKRKKEVESYERENTNRGKEKGIDDVKKMNYIKHVNKSYMGKAFLTLFLYSLLIIPGLIANIIYLKRAGRTKEVTGESPSGYGCLIFLIVTGVLNMLALISFIIGGGAVLSDIF